jgi:hypothetical protein
MKLSYIVCVVMLWLVWCIMLDWYNLWYVHRNECARCFRWACLCKLELYRIQYLCDYIHLSFVSLLICCVVYIVACLMKAGIISVENQVECELGGRQSKTARDWDSHSWWGHGRKSGPHNCKPLHSSTECCCKIVTASEDWNRRKLKLKEVITRRPMKMQQAEKT